MKRQLQGIALVLFGILLSVSGDSVNDDYIDDIQERLLIFDSFCHTIDIPMKGLKRKLLIEAKKRNKNVIHFGL